MPFTSSLTLAKSCPCLSISLPIGQKTGFGSNVSFCPSLLPTLHLPALAPKPYILCRNQFSAGNKKLDRRKEMSPLVEGASMTSLASFLWLAAGDLNCVTFVQELSSRISEHMTQPTKHTAYAYPHGKSMHQCIPSHICNTHAPTNPQHADSTHTSPRHLYG